MPAVIRCDAHQQFSVFVEIDSKGKTSPPVRIEHSRQQYVDFLHTLPPRSEIALEATGHWYWMVDEIEKAGHRPHLANPTEAKKRMGKTNKTDALGAKCLAILLHNGTLPESWIPPGELRDRRELLRTRMALRDLRSSLKHRIHPPSTATDCRPPASPISSASRAASISTPLSNGIRPIPRP
jgi:transposase